MTDELGVDMINRGAVSRQARTILARLFGGRPSAPRTRPTLAELERDYILKTLAEVGGNKRRAARELGITRSTLHRKLAGWTRSPRS